MEKTPKELFEAKTKRIKDAINLEIPDKVPFSPVLHFFPAKYAGMTYEEEMYDYGKLASSVKKLTLDFKLDTTPDVFRPYAIGSTLEALDYLQIKWPGHGLEPNLSYQFVEGEYMKADEYDEFLFDPSGFILRKQFPRIMGKMAPFAGINPIPWAWYTRIVPYVASFAKPEFKETFEALVKAGKEAQKAITAAKVFMEEMEDLGYPRQFVGSVYAPFDYIGDFFRGMRGIMLDMYRQPDKLLEAIDKATHMMIDQVHAIKHTDYNNRVFIPLHKGLDGFMSPAQFNKFYWPSLKKVILELIEAGFTPNPLWEGDCTSRLEIIGDMPRGKVVYWFERTDIFKAKEVLGDTICIEGGIPSSIMITGTPDDTRDYCKKLIDIVGKGGGFILNGDIGIPDEARIENVRALADFIKEYGTYN